MMDSAMAGPVNPRRSWSDEIERLDRKVDRETSERQKEQVSLEGRVTEKVAATLKDTVTAAVQNGIVVAMTTGELRSNTCPHLPELQQASATLAAVEKLVTSFDDLKKQLFNGGGVIPSQDARIRDVEAGLKNLAPFHKGPRSRGHVPHREESGEHAEYKSGLRVDPSPTGIRAAIARIPAIFWYFLVVQFGSMLILYAALASKPQMDNLHSIVREVIHQEESIESGKPAQTERSP